MVTLFMGNGGSALGLGPWCGADGLGQFKTHGTVHNICAQHGRARGALYGELL